MHTQSHTNRVGEGQLGYLVGSISLSIPQGVVMNCIPTGAKAVYSVGAVTVVN